MLNECMYWSGLWNMRTATFSVYRVYYVSSSNTVLLKIILRLIYCGIVYPPLDVFSALKGAVARLFLCVVQDGEQAETVLQIALHI